MKLNGTIGADWLRPTTRGKVQDADLRQWRDHLEEQLEQLLGLAADLTIGERTQFSLPPDSSHTPTEIESFARRALDRFLNRKGS